MSALKATVLPMVAVPTCLRVWGSAGYFQGMPLRLLGDNASKYLAF